MKTKHVTGLFAAGLTLFGCVVLLGRRKPSSTLVVEPPVATVIEPELVPAALEMVDGRVVVSDWSEWMKSAPFLIRDVVRSGEKRPSAIAAAVMRAVLPDHPWPPELGTPAAKQWAELVKTVADVLQLEPEPEEPRLRVVR